MSANKQEVNSSGQQVCAVLRDAALGVVKGSGVVVLELFPI